MVRPSLIGMGGKWRARAATGLAARNHFVVYGQSRSVGQNPTPAVLTPASAYGALMLNAGLRGDPYDVASQTFTALVPLAEAISPLNPSVFGETPAAGMVEMIGQLLADEEAESIACVATCPGIGSNTLAQLTVSTAPYSELMERVDRVSALSESVGSAVQAVAFLQGESDYIAGTTRAAYVSALAAFATALRAAVVRGSPQTDSPLIIIPQISSHLYLPTATPTIALAQQDARSAAATVFALACPEYIGDFESGDWHSGPQTMKWEGAYCGLTWKRRVYDGIAGWDGCMRIVSAVRSGDGIDVTLNPLGALAFDTTWVTALADGNYGFQVVDSAADPVAVTGVTITGAATIRVACAAGGGAGSVLRYGWAGTTGETAPGRATGARGNVRDSYGDTITFEIEEGDVRPMHRWLAISEVATT